MNYPKCGQSASPAATAPHALPGLLERVKNIVLGAENRVAVIEAEPTSVARLYSGYAMPMAAFAAVMSFIRMSVIGVPLPFGGLMRMSFASGLFSSVLTFAMGLIGLHLVGLVINVLASSFGGQQNRRQALEDGSLFAHPRMVGYCPDVPADG